MRERKEENDSKQPAAGLTIRWPVLSWVLLAIAASAVGALIVNTSVARSGEAALSTVALMLAVLSFAAQLIVTATQSHSSNEHYRDLSALSHDAHKALTEITAQVKSVTESQQANFDKMLNYVVESTFDPTTVQRIAEQAAQRSSVGAETPPSNGGEEGVSTAATVEAIQQIKEQLSQSIAEVRAMQSKENINPRYQARFDKLTYKASRGLDAIMSLSPNDARDFMRAAASMRELPFGIQVGGRQGKPLPWVIAAESAGLVKSHKASEDVWVVAATEIGSSAIEAYYSRIATPDLAGHRISQVRQHVSEGVGSPTSAVPFDRRSDMKR